MSTKYKYKRFHEYMDAITYANQFDNYQIEEKEGWFCVLAW